MKRLLAFAATAVLFSLPFSPAMAAEKVTYLLPAPEILPAFAPFQLARAKGYFEEADLDVTFRSGKGGADVATQLAVGNADLGGAIGDTPIIVRANGLEVRGVALLGGRGLTQIAWRKDSGITGFQDLKGKSIGVLSFQDTTYYNLLGVLASQGLGKNDVNIQAVGPGGIIQLTIADRLQALSGVPEWISAIETADVELEQQSVDTVFPAMAQAIMASDKVIAERPAVVEAFVKAVLQAVRDIQADPQQAAKDYTAAVPQHAGKEDEIESIMRAYVEKVYPEAEGQPLGAFDPERLSAAQAFYVDKGIVQTVVPIAELYTNEFVQ